MLEGSGCQLPMAMVAIKMGMRSVIILHKISVQHYIHQVGWEEDGKVDSPEQKTGPSKDASLQ